MTLLAIFSVVQSDLSSDKVSFDAATEHERAK